MVEHRYLLILKRGIKVMRLQAIFVSIILAIIAGGGFGQYRRGVPEGVVVHRDVAYVSGGHKRQKLDLYLPRAEKKLPLIIYVHGGAWLAGSKEFNVPSGYLAEGYAVASINYRLSQHALFPAQIEDCKAAVRWLRANAEKYNIDANHGDADPLVPCHQSVLLEAALKKAGVPVKFYIVRKEGHGGFKDPNVPKLTKEFFDKQLKRIQPKTKAGQ